MTRELLSLFFFLLKRHLLSEVLLDWLFRNCTPIRDYHLCTLYPSPMSNLSLNDIHFTYLLPFGFSCKNASSTRNWNFFFLVFWSVLNPQHLEDSMAYNWLPLNISWVNGSTSMISIAIFIWFPICSSSLVLFPKFKIYIFNCLFESPQNISDSAYLRLNSLSCLPISPHIPPYLLTSPLPPTILYNLFYGDYQPSIQIPNEKYRNYPTQILIARSLTVLASMSSLY